MKLVLDTNVVRGLAEGDRSDGLVAYCREGGSIHFADTAIVEILEQLQAGKLTWSRWARASVALEAFLDPVDPIMMGGREVLAAAGIVVESATPSLAETEHRQLNRDLWGLLRRATSMADITANSSILLLQGIPQRVSLDMPQGPAVVEEEEKTSWIQSFVRKKEVADSVGLRPLTRADETEAFAVFIRETSEYIDANAVPSSPSVSVRLDALIRVYALLSVRSLKAKSPYNARKDANDVFDVDLLRYLALPAAVCTNDAGIHNDLHAANSWQREWVVRVVDLEDARIRRRIIDLSWPDAATS